jgi:hypothetical protein
LAYVTADANSRLTSQANEHQHKLLETEKTFHDRLEQLRRENKAREEQWA